MLLFSSVSTLTDIKKISFKAPTCEEIISPKDMPLTDTTSGASEPEERQRHFQKPTPPTSDLDCSMEMPIYF